MVECHAGLEIAPYISSAMRRETLFSTSQKPRTDVDRGEGLVVVVVVGARESRAAVSLDFLIRTKLDVHMHTRSPPSSSSSSSLYSSNGGSSLWAFFPFACAFFFLLSTSDKPLTRLLVIHPASTVEFYTFRSRVSFSLGRIIRLKIGTLAEKRIEKSSLTEKKNERKNIQEEKKRIYFSIFSLELYIPAEYYRLCCRRQVEKLHAQYYWIGAHGILLQQEQNAFYALWMKELNIFSYCIRFHDCLRHN